MNNLLFGGWLLQCHPIKRNKKEKAEIGEGTKGNLIIGTRITSFKTFLKEKHASRKFCPAKEKVCFRGHLQDFQDLKL
ncbi:MAG: hypothetical protein R6V39_00270 [Desulfovibrionales bacterium]